MKTKKVIGIDLGGTKLATVLFNVEGRAIDKSVTPIGSKKGEEVGALIIKELESMLSKTDNEVSVGISVPGIYNSKNGNVWAPNIPGWEQYPLYEKIMTILQDKGISLSIDSDRSCYILGEYWQGNAKGCENAIFIAVGTGIGAGIIVNGTILRGISASAGAIGWMALNRPYLEEYKSYGCFESHASGEGIVRMAQKYIDEDASYDGLLKKDDKKNLNTEDVFKAYKLNDPIGERAINEAVQYWGMATANLVSIFNPEKVLLGGGVFDSASNLLSRIIKEAKHWAQPIAMKDVTIELAGLGNEAGIYGAGYLGLSNKKKK